MIEADTAYWGKFQSAVVPLFDSYEEVDLFFQLSRGGAHGDPDFKKKIDLLFDHEKLVRWYALSLLAGNLHVGGDNLRFFWDISRGRFEPIVWDISSTAPGAFFTLPGNGLWSEVFSIPEWKQETHDFLQTYIAEEADDDLKEAGRLRSLIERAAYRDPLKLQSNRQVRHDLDQRMAEVRANMDFLRQELSGSGVAIPVPLQ